MVLLVQREVAEKICGLTGKSLITIETQLYGRPEIVDIVPPNAFHPAPKVQSAIIKIEVYKKPLISEGNLADFLRVVKFGFSQKRKKLKSSLAAGLHIKPSEMAEILEASAIDPNLRAENLEIKDWERLSKVLNKLQK
jgi:16S rRNA (adenine1518-N6/adenine1519-N6)-dimethyltransferase